MGGLQATDSIALLYALILALWFTGRAKLRPIGFYAMFAIVVTASVQLVGVYWSSPA